ncbi:MAG: SprB repeat-containing protein [Bacteroidales bacterium]|jgi:hypothetical protein
MKMDTAKLFTCQWLLMAIAPTIITMNGYSQDSVKTDDCRIKLEYSVKDVSCKGGDDGAIDLTAVHADRPEYLWSNGGTSEDLSMLAAGKYSVTVNDSECSATLSVTVGQPAAELALNVREVTDATCPGYSDGIVELSATGGTGPYEFGTDKNEEFQADDVFEGLQAGAYPFHVRDRNLCTVAALVTVKEPVLPGIDLGTDISIHSGEVISFDAGPGYSDYLWSTGETSGSIDFSREVTETITELISVDAVDENGCSISSNQVEVTIIPVSPEPTEE